MVPSLIDPSTGVPTTADPTAGPTPSATPPPGLQPQRLWQSSYGDYMTGNYVLAVEGFESYIRYFPKSPQAPEAQLYIGEALANDKKEADAVAAYDRVIANYPGSASVPTAYYKRGLALERLKETDRARESYEAVIKQFADSHQAQLARQALERMSRPAR
jgi:tol-pal system protein YbgF